MALHTLSAARSRGDAALLPKSKRRAPDLTKVRRQRLEIIVEHLLHLLDTLDGDPDLEREPDEDDGAEASLQRLCTPDAAPLARRRGCRACGAIFPGQTARKPLCGQCRRFA